MAQWHPPPPPPNILENTPYELAGFKRLYFEFLNSSFKLSASNYMYFCFVLSGCYSYFTWFKTFSIIKLLDIFLCYCCILNYFYYISTFFQDTGVIYFSDLKIKTAKCEIPKPRRPYCEFCFLHFCKRNIVFPSECIMAISSKLREGNTKHFKRKLYVLASIRLL